MNITQALMIVRNATSGYSDQQIREAVSIVLSSLDATEEDVWDAGSALGYLDDRKRTASFAPGSRCSDLDAHPFSGAISAGDF